MARLPVALVSGLAVAILGAGSVVSARAALDEAAQEHDQAVAERLPRAVASAFRKHGIPLASSIIDSSSLDVAPPVALEFPAARLRGNNCFAIYVYEEKPPSLVLNGAGRVSCQEILRQRVRSRAPPTGRGTIVGHHYVVIYSLQPRLLRLVESAMAAAVRVDH